MLGGMSKPSDSAAWWREIVRNQAQSGMSVAAYCRRSRVPQSSFYAWRRKLGDMGFSPAGHMGVPPAARRDASTFAAVRVTPRTVVAGSQPYDAASEAGALEVRLAGGRCIVVRAGFDRATLLALLEALESGAGDPAGVANREVRV